LKTASANAGLRAYLQKLQVGSYATPADNALRIRLQRLATLGTYQHRHIMPPAVAQTAPAFADLAAELPAVAGANVAHRDEYDDRSVVLPKLPPLAQDFHDELHGYKSADIRAYFQQLDDDWTRSVLLPSPPSAFEDWTWTKDFSWLYVKPFDGEPIDFARPIVQPLAYDESDSARRFDWLYAPQTARAGSPESAAPSTARV
jgi:hypothetical protein